LLGDGAFGTVTKCRDKETGDLVAVKKIKGKFPSFDECLQLKEVKSLRKIKHPNIVKLLQIFRESETLFLVFELLGESLVDTMEKKSNKFSEAEIRDIAWQMFTGLAYVHKQGFFHRDMKPDNLLWKDAVLKICDFGLAKEIRARPPFTEYVSTRWYRAPEIICRAPYYNCPVDIWAAGAIMAELYMGRPIFPGISDTDQLFKIINVLGTPTAQLWPDIAKLQQKMRLRFQIVPPMALELLMPNASPSAISLLREIFRYDPARRPSASQILQHPFFAQGSARVLAPGPVKPGMGFVPRAETRGSDPFATGGLSSGRRAVSSAAPMDIGMPPDNGKDGKGRRVSECDEGKKRFAGDEDRGSNRFLNEARSEPLRKVAMFRDEDLMPVPLAQEPRLRPPPTNPYGLGNEGTLLAKTKQGSQETRKLTESQDFEALLDALGKDL
jgi:protein kinase